MPLSSLQVRYGWNLDMRDLQATKRDGNRHPRVEVDHRKRTTLSERQKQVLELAAMGDLNKVIAFKLGIAEGNVKGILCKCSRKLGVRGRVLLARWWWESKMAEDELLW